jgi:hypothetical protein
MEFLAGCPLPGQGLIVKDSIGTLDMFHLAPSENFYDNQFAVQSGWSVRKITAMQALDAVRRRLTERP